MAESNRQPLLESVAGIFEGLTRSETILRLHDALPP